MVMNLADWKRRGCPCPCCESTSVKSRGEPDVTFKGGTQDFVCQSCGAEWEVYWVLQDFSVKRESDPATVKDHLKLRALAAFICLMGSWRPRNV